LEITLQNVVKGSTVFGLLQHIEQNAIHLLVLVGLLTLLDLYTFFVIPVIQGLRPQLIPDEQDDRLLIFADCAYVGHWQIDFAVVLVQDEG